jgi:DNA-binding NarL/FixJ family response regulator
MPALNRILIVDDHAPFRSALRGFLSEQADMLIVGEAANLHDAIDCVVSMSPDLVLTDLTMPDARGIEAVTEIKRHYPDMNILVLSSHAENEYKRCCRNAGAAGYIAKNAISDELCAGIRAVLSGEYYLAANAAGAMAAVCGR